MPSQKSTAYHLFLVLAILHLLIYFVFVGQSVVDVHQREASIFSGELFNYFVAVSLCVLLIWISYWVTRRKWISGKWVRVHLLVTSLTLYLIPLVISQSFNGMPARYYCFDNGFQLSDIFGSMTLRFQVVVSILFVSELMLIKNFQQQSKS